ncbi:MAG: outer membrane protein transport protein [Chitinophagaceae bacterium]|nr:outer membrane protein transport protein [Chitinophagaceae bacterium]
MKKLTAFLIAFGTIMFGYAQVGHIMQGIGAVNTSMGGAATGQAIDLSGAIYWNPAGIAAFKGKQLSIDAGLFLSAPSLSSTVPTPGGPMSGTTEDERGASVMPAIAYGWNKKDSKHHFALSAFGVSGFGVYFPENMSNPINMPQSMGGFGTIRSDYMLMQVGFTYAYELSDKWSVGIQPLLNWSALQLEPNPLASPSMTKGYPKTDKASAFGAGAQIGLYYNSGNGFKAGLSYKTQQYFNEFTLKNQYLDGSAAPDTKFTMNYPAIFSAGLGYSTKQLDIAADYRMVNYESTDGFSEEGWTSTASVKGFGWKNISVVSAGIQYKGFEKVPIRVGYTYSSNPISSELAFFSVPATAIIKHAFQIGTGFQLGAKGRINLTYHHGTSSGETSGPLCNPMMISPSNPYGAIPGSRVAYDMSTDLFLLGYHIDF